VVPEYVAASRCPQTEPATQGGEKEYYLATAAEEIYVAPTAQFSLRGFKVAGAQHHPYIALCLM